MDVKINIEDIKFVNQKGQPVDTSTVNANGVSSSGMHVGEVVDMSADEQSYDFSKLY